jgi:transposase-like protein
MRTKPTKSFKADMNLPKLIAQFGSDEKCREQLTSLRWPNGVICPRCQSKSISTIVKRPQYDCNACRYQFSVTSGTIFHDTHLPLSKWFLAIYLMTESKKGISALQIKRTLCIGYEAAWYLYHRIRAAMREINSGLLRGIVEVDETYVGGKVRGGTDAVTRAIRLLRLVRFNVKERFGFKLSRMPLSKSCTSSSKITPHRTPLTSLAMDISTGFTSIG